MTPPNTPEALSEKTKKLILDYFRGERDFWRNLKKDFEKENARKPIPEPTFWQKLKRLINIFS